MVIIKDNVYGQFEINEPVLEELLVSPPLLRLKKISQFGIPPQFYHFKYFYRYEHSLGVMLLLRKLGASLEEQVAGLIHDISHLAFSHVADWVFAEGNKRGEEDLQDSLFEKFVRETQVGKILKKHCFDVDRLIDESNYPLLEKKIPDLCADRIDSSLREFKYWLNPALVEASLADLTVFDQKIVFKSPKTAFNFAFNFLELQRLHWGGREAIVRYYLFAQALKAALAKKIISQDDFYQDDEYILNKIEKSGVFEIKEILAVMAEGKIKALPRKTKEKVVKKFRHVDPEIIQKNRLVRLSAVEPKFKKALLKNRQINEKGIIV
jgi:hypothetical protein